MLLCFLVVFNHVVRDALGRFGGHCREIVGGTSGTPLGVFSGVCGRFVG